MKIIRAIAHWFSAVWGLVKRLDRADESTDTLRRVSIGNDAFCRKRIHALERAQEINDFKFNAIAKELAELRAKKK